MYLSSSLHICPVLKWHEESCVLLLFTIKVGGSTGIPIAIPLDMVSAIGSAALGHSPLAALIPGDQVHWWSSTHTTFHCGSQLCLRIVGERCVEKMKNAACLLEQSILVLEV